MRTLKREGIQRSIVKLKVSIKTQQVSKPLVSQRDIEIVGVVNLSMGRNLLEFFQQYLDLKGGAWTTIKVSCRWSP